MMPSFSAFPQAMPQPSPFEVMPMSGAAPIMDTPRQAAVMPMTQEVAPVAPYQPLPAVQPMTQEAAPFDLSSLAGLDLSGLGGFGGGRMGGVLQNDPNQEYITAPVSNKGNPTGRMGGNVFVVTPEQPVRLVDHRTNQVVFEGTGYDAARKATELGQGLTDQFGRKANYSIQTADPTGAYNTVAYEKKNKSTLGTIANVAGTLLPLAMIPLTAGASAGSLLASTAGKIGLGTALGAAGAGLKGDNILKGAAMGGLSAAGGSLLGAPLGKVGDIGLRAGTAIGTGLGATAGGLATGQDLKSSLLGGVASGAISYLSPDIVKGLGINQGAPVSTGGDINADLVPNALEGLSFGPLASASIPAGVGGAPGIGGAPSIGGAPNPIIVSGTGSVPGAVTSSLNLGDLSPEILAGMAEFGRNPIISEGSKIERPTSVSTDVLAGIAEFEKNPIVAEASKLERPTSLSPDVLAGMAEFERNPIVAEGSKILRPEPISVVPDIGLGIGSITSSLPVPKADPALTEKSTLDKIRDAVDIARVGGALLPLIPGGGGGGTGGIGSGTGGGLTFTKSPLRPTLTGAGIGGRYPYTPTTYGRTGGDQETEYLFFTRDPETGATTAIPAPITTPIANESAAPAMIMPSGNNFAEGGEVDDDMVKHLVDYHKNGGHQGPGQVKGIGSGQEDKIPAWLSDGEYVWSAQDVSDLGDGSNKEGVRRLDKMRQMVRRQAGRKDVKKIAKPQKGIDTMLKAVGGMV
jgi:hypothetical protein